jgi:ATP-dependent helicase HrpB
MRVVFRWQAVSPSHSLPIDEILPQIIHSLRDGVNLVIEAPPGAGKTTRVPAALLEIVRGEVIVLEPRRIAARLAARRVAAERGEAVGQTVGYQVRFEEAVSRRTRLRFVTEGILTRRLLSDPTLKGVAAVVLDEFHERHLEGDLALALLKRLQRTRPDLRIIVMSATLDAEAIAKFLDDCPRLRSSGRQYELTIEYQPYSNEPLEAQLKSAVKRLVAEQHSGHILAFLPGTAEIRRAMRQCEAVAKSAGLLMLPLHGALTPQEQERAVGETTQRKLILATNVAESSVTIDGVTAVIDSGLARLATYSPWSGLPTLHVGRISKASAKQRAGRAGRTAPGRVLRLYSEQDYQHRPEQPAPEILRADLSQLCLMLRAMGVEQATELEWLDAPPEAAVRAAEGLLQRLGATGVMARRLAQYPLAPRLSRILVEAVERGVGEQGCVAAAVLETGTSFQTSDLLSAIESKHDRQTAQRVEQLRRLVRTDRQQRHNDEALLISVLAGFPDRVARLRAGNQVLLSSGSSAEIAGEIPQYEFMVAVDAEDRKDKPLPLVRMTSRIEPEWLIDLFAANVREEARVVWNRSAERVDAVSVLLYDELVIQETRGAVPESGAAAAMLAEKALETGIERFVDIAALHELLERLEFAGLETPDVAEVLRDACSGLRSFAELKGAGRTLVTTIAQKVAGKQLNDVAPARIAVQNGRYVKVHYERGKTPWIAARLQDFFGMRETPRIGPKRIPVVVHLLAPNRQPVQTTTDLAGFWERLYPQVRRELMRKYPKHAWPERPL